jgi:hypothetical protein
MVPRSGVATIAPKGVTRFCSGIDERTLAPSGTVMGARTVSDGLSNGAK